jgi:ArsR family transcriptional regulator
MEEPAPRCQKGEHATPEPRIPPAALARAAQLFRAMGEASRLRILELLKPGEMCVTEIVAAVNEKFSTVSQRLRILRSEGLIARRREGTHVFYRLADRHVVDLIRNALAHADELEAGPGQTSSEEE